MLSRSLDSGLDLGLGRYILRDYCVVALLVRLTELLILAGLPELAELAVDLPGDVTTVPWTARGDLQARLFLVSFGAFFECQ